MATPPALQAFEPHLGPQPASNTLYSPQQVTLILKEKVFSLSGDTFTVQTAEGTNVLQVKGKVASLHARKTFSDMAGEQYFSSILLGVHHWKRSYSFATPMNADVPGIFIGAEILVLAEKKLKLFKTFYGESPAGHNFDIEGHFSFGSSKSTVSFVNAGDKAPIELQVKGDWFDRCASIKLGERTVASVSRSFANAREVFGGKQTYFVTVAPNMDLSLIAAICVGLDERENEK
ncbi:Putative tubby-like protein [Septoria linicola]|uniref:Tubby-like protein n=1 Tax=Septoria linicola TaxID=215465 RepID=A0A9Q9AEI6_9PEZI|nr:putative tubby-like protein [Septoria linicola]USW47645.1 Putative tubby-like protein [Septoria linicola]